MCKVCNPNNRPSNSQSSCWVIHEESVKCVGDNICDANQWVETVTNGGRHLLTVWMDISID